MRIPRWMEACVEEELPPTTELEEGLRNGVYLGKLAKFFAPKMVSEKKIYDRDQARYKVTFVLLPRNTLTLQINILSSWHDAISYQALLKLLSSYLTLFFRPLI